MDVERVKQLVVTGAYQMSGHAEEEREAETILLEDVKSAIQNGELLEDYPDDPRGASCLMLGNSTDDRPLHIVLVMLTKIEAVRIITVYRPMLPKWTDPRSRAVQGEE